MTSNNYILALICDLNNIYDVRLNHLVIFIFYSRSFNLPLSLSRDVTWVGICCYKQNNKKYKNENVI